MEIVSSMFMLNALKIVVAMLCGGLIGLERSRQKKTGGIRTQILVAGGATLFMIISGSLQFSIISPVQMAGQVVIGIGIVVAGFIIKDRATTDSITTGASVWITAAIGCSIGVGLFLEAIFVAIITYLGLGWLHRFLNV